MSDAFPPAPGSSSPWGPIQSVTALGTEALIITTASHGGLCISPDALQRVPAPLRRTAYSQGGWFEEDCDWAIPYLALALHRFEADVGRGEHLRDLARRTIWTYHRPHAALLNVATDPALAQVLALYGSS